MEGKNMKKTFKVISTIFSIIGAIVVGDLCIAAIVVKMDGKSPAKFFKDAYDFGYDYID